MKVRSLTIAGLLIVAVAAHADVAVVAVGGDAAPDGNGKLGDFDVPSMNQSGQVTFVATLAETTAGNNDNTGIFRASAVPGSLTMIVRRGAPSPDGNGNFALFDSNSAPVINDSGQVAFIAGLAGTFGGAGGDETGMFRGDGTGGLTQLVRQGQTLPGTGLGPGMVPNLRGGGIGEPFSFNETGDVAFALVGSGIFRTSGTSLIAIVRSLQPLPGGGLTSTVFAPPALNDMGQVAFADPLMGIYRGDGSTILPIAHSGDPAPGGNGSFTLPFSAAAINNSGAVAFFAPLNGTSGSASDNQGIFIRKGDSLTTIVRRGQAAPDGNGRFLDLNGDVAVNEAGQTAFVATLTATANGAIDNTGLFRGDGTTLTQIVRTGDKAPDGRSINSLGKSALNDAGQVAFLAGLVASAGGSAGHAILLYDDQRGLLQAVRTGDPLAGSIIAPTANLIFEPSVTANGKKRSGLNEHGLVVFRFDLNDGRRGIAVADPFTMSATATPTSSPTPTATGTAAPGTPCQGRRCVTPPSTPATSPTSTPTGCVGGSRALCPPIPTATPGAGVCAGDCDGSHDVAVNEIVQLVNFALGSSTDCSTCPNGIPPGTTCPADITVSIIIQAVNNALNACPVPTPTRGSK